MEERAGIIVPVLPVMKIPSAKMKFEESYVQDRMVALDRFIQRVVGHPELVDAPCLLPFFTASPADWTTTLEASKKSASDIEASNHSSVNGSAKEDENTIIISSEEVPVPKKKTGYFGKWMSAKRDEWALRNKNLVLEETPAETKKFENIQAYAEHLETCIRILAEDSILLGETQQKQAGSFKTMGAAFSQLWGEHELSNTSSSTMYQTIGDIWNNLCKQVEEQFHFRRRHLETPFDELVLDVVALKEALATRKKIVYEYTKKVQEGRTMQQQMDKLRAVSDLSQASDQYFALERDIRISDVELVNRKKFKDLITDRLSRDTDRFRIEWHERMRALLENYHKEQLRFIREQGNLWEKALPCLAQIDDNRAALPTGPKKVDAGDISISYTSSGAKATYVHGSSLSATDTAISYPVVEEAPPPIPAATALSSTTSFDSVTLDENAPMGGVAAAPPASAPPPPPEDLNGPKLASL